MAHPLCTLLPHPAWPAAPSAESKEFNGRCPPPPQAPSAAPSAPTAGPVLGGVRTSAQHPSLYDPHSACAHGEAAPGRKGRTPTLTRRTRNAISSESPLHVSVPSPKVLTGLNWIRWHLPAPLQLIPALRHMLDQNGFWFRQDAPQLCIPAAESTRKYNVPLEIRPPQGSACVCVCVRADTPRIRGKSFQGIS